MQVINYEPEPALVEPELIDGEVANPDAEPQYEDVLAQGTEETVWGEVLPSQVFSIDGVFYMMCEDQGHVYLGGKKIGKTNDPFSYGLCNKRNPNTPVLLHKNATLVITPLESPTC